MYVDTGYQRSRESEKCNKLNPLEKLMLGLFTPNVVDV